MSPDSTIESATVMPAPTPARRGWIARTDEVSLLALGAAVLRRRRLILVLGFLGGLAGLLFAVVQPRLYASQSTFIPQDAESGISDLAMAASQLGIRLPTSSSGTRWTPAVYVELLTSRALLAPIARDTFTAVEVGRSATLMDLLGVEDENPERQLVRAVRVLASDVIEVSEVRHLGAVRLTVRTQWPSVSHAIATRLVAGVNTFNYNTRRSQASAERQFVEARAAEAESALRAAEDRLRAFLQANRTISPASTMAFEAERLQREVTLRQELHTSWMKSREEARIREVRNTPVITVIEEPRRPVIPEARRTILKAALGGIGGTLLGIFIAFVTLLTARARRTPDSEAQEFFALVDQVRPRFLKRTAAHR
jgi:uncharacterized protein involved in exopolysaccharide biosynthesis